VSIDALACAQVNADRLGLGDQVDVVNRGVATLASTGPCDLLLANLPYVSRGEWEGLAREIREYEPREALVAGETGLEAIEGLLDSLAGLEWRGGRGSAPPRGRARAGARG